MRAFCVTLHRGQKPNGIAYTTAKKEAKRLEKEAKLAAKTAKVGANTPAGEKKAKAEKAKKEEEPTFVNTTPTGEKKGTCVFILCAIAD